MQTTKSKATLIQQYCWGALFCSVIGAWTSLYIFERVDPDAIAAREEREDLARMRDLYFGEPADTRMGQIAQDMEMAKLSIKMTIRNEEKRRSKEQQSQQR